MHLFLVDDSIEHEKGKGVDKYVVEKVTRIEHRNVLLSKFFLRHSGIRIQSESYKIGTCEINIFICLALMIKYISWSIDMLDYLFVIRGN